MFERHPLRPVGPVRRGAEPHRTAETNRAAQVQAHHFERVVPAVAEEPAPQLRGVEHTFVPTHAFRAQVGLMPLEIAEPIEPGVCAHP